MVIYYYKIINLLYKNINTPKQKLYYTRKELTILFSIRLNYDFKQKNISSIVGCEEFNSNGTRN